MCNWLEACTNGLTLGSMLRENGFSQTDMLIRTSCEAQQSQACRSDPKDLSSAARAVARKPTTSSYVYALIGRFKGPLTGHSDGIACVRV